MIDQGVAVALGIQALIVAVAWGDLRRGVQKDREQNTERHEENREILEDISEDVKRINGTVTRHDVQIVLHGKELDRLRDRKG